MTNTVGCLGMLLLLYNADLTALINEMVAAGSAEAAYLDNAGTWLVAAVGVPNGIGEAVAAAVIVPVIKIAVDAVLHRSRRRKAASARR